VTTAGGAACPAERGRRSVGQRLVREVTLVERLTALDASFLYLEEPSTPMHVGGVIVLKCPEGGGLDHEALIELVHTRLPLVPRYRQKVV
jgi:diacylglycerol O-acyltransferase / wax synthase